MYGLLFDRYYFTVFGVVLILLLIAAMIAIAYWRLRKRWQQEMEALQKDLEALLHQVEALQEELESVRTIGRKAHLPFAAVHDLPTRLRSIAKKSELTLKELDREQVGTRERQRVIIAQAYDSAQRAANLVSLFKLGREKPELMLLNLKSTVLRVSKELCLFADSEEVEIVPDLHDLEPILLDRDFTSYVLTNVIHNAIKNSYQGGVVRVLLRLEEDETETTKRNKACVTVEDTGKGIKKELQNTIFELGDSLGLYYARELCRLQGGDVILVRSEVNKGSVFKIIFPYESQPGYWIRNH